MQRLKQAYSGQGTCHAVAVGSSFEPAVLKAIAGLGGGSLRRVSGEEGPTSVAAALLREIAQPALRDLKVEFRGFQAARVYPEQLTNLPAGSQQILLGLYQPGKADQKPAAVEQTGEVLVTATQDGKPVKFSAQVSFQGAEQGNSFIPRLWAKMHLDNLLAQGASASIRDEIIALSEEFQIMTPYTSFLVLESDADRERFKVQRRFRMRDGEKYFQQGRDNANFELVQQQMQRAGNWRLGLKRMALARLAMLGRDARLFAARHPSRIAGPWGGPSSSTALGRMSGIGGAGGGGEHWYFDDNKSLNGRANLMSLGDDSSLGISDTSPTDEGPSEAKDAEAGIPFSGEMDQKGKLAVSLDEFDAADIADHTEPAAREPAGRPRDKRESLDSYLVLHADNLINSDDLFDRLPGSGPFDMAGKPPSFEFGRLLRGGLYASRGRYSNSPDYLSWVNTLFPLLPPAERAKPGKPRAPTWPDATRTLSSSLLRSDALTQLPGGLEIIREAQSFEPRWTELTSRHQRIDLFLKDRWLTRTIGDNAQTIVQWADAAEPRGDGAGVRAGAGSQVAPERCFPRGARPQRLRLSRSQRPFPEAPLHETYREYTLTIERADDGRTLLILKLPSAPQHETRVLIDTARHVIVSIEQRQNGKPTSLSKFDDFVEVAGLWWGAAVGSYRRCGPAHVARHAVCRDRRGRRTGRANQIRAGGSRAACSYCICLCRCVKAAKQAQLRLGELTFEDQFVLLLHFIQSQQWQKVFEQLEKCEQLSAGKPGVRWIRFALLAVGRRHEELKTRLAEEARRLENGESVIEKQPVADPQRVAGDELFLANYILGQAAGVLEANENLKLLAGLKAVYARQPAHRQSLKGWQDRHIGLLQSIGQADEALRELKQLASENPRDYGLQQRYAQTVFNNGDNAAAYDWLTQALAAETRWHDYESDSLRSTYASFLQQQGRFSDLAEYLARGIERNSENQTVYQQYLSALIQADHIPRFEALLAEWLKPGTTPDDLSPVAAARLNAAISLAFGHGYYVYSDRLDEKWQSSAGRHRAGDGPQPPRLEPRAADHGAMAVSIDRPVPARARRDREIARRRTGDSLAGTGSDLRQLDYAQRSTRRRRNLAGDRRGPAGSVGDRTRSGRAPRARRIPGERDLQPTGEWRAAGLPA